MKTKIIFDEKDKKKLKDKFNISMEEEINKLTSEIIEKEDNKKFDGTVYKKKIKDGVEVVDKVVIHNKKNKQKSPQILENVPEEFKKGNKKILLEG